jgi:hypothetical protein
MVTNLASYSEAVDIISHPVPTSFHCFSTSLWQILELSIKIATTASFYMHFNVSTFHSTL